MQRQEKDLKLFSIFKDLFDTNYKRNTEDDFDSKLFTVNAINYFLKSCVCVRDDKWVLAIIDINNLKQLNTESHQRHQGLTVKALDGIVYNFCQRQPFKFKGFRCVVNINDNATKKNVFGMLIYCRKNFDFAEKQTNILIQEIKDKMGDNNNVGISIGISKMSDGESFEEWKDRAIRSMKLTKSHDECKTDHDASLANDDDDEVGISVDMNSVLTNWQISRYLGDENDFESRIRKIEIDEDGDWFLAMLARDCGVNDHDYDHDNEKIIREIRNEILKLIVFFKGDNKLIVGYELQLSGDGKGKDNGKFALIIYDTTNNKDKNENKETVDKNISKQARKKCILSSKEIVSVLIENIERNCNVRVSVGFACLNGKEKIGEWKERANLHLNQAKKNGKNSIYFGDDLKKFQIDEEDVSSNNQDDLINLKTKSIQTLQAELFLYHNASFVFFFFVTHPCTISTFLFWIFWIFCMFLSLCRRD